MGKRKKPGETRAFQISSNQPLLQRPSVIALGRPCSQPFGEFHGLTEAFSDSVVAQPVSVIIKQAAAKPRIILLTNFMMQDELG
jgi:hypothetical protein